MLSEERVRQIVLEMIPDKSTEPAINESVQKSIMQSLLDDGFADIVIATYLRGNFNTNLKKVSALKQNQTLFNSKPQDDYQRLTFLYTLFIISGVKINSKYEYVFDFVKSFKLIDVFDFPILGRRNTGRHIKQMLSDEGFSFKMTRSGCRDNGITVSLPVYFVNGITDDKIISRKHKEILYTMGLNYGQ